MSLSLQRFSELLDAYGSDLQRWPEPQRVAAQALLMRSEVARERLSAWQSEEIDLALPNLEAPSAALRQRILRDAMRLLPPRPGFWRELLELIGGWRPAAAPLAAALVVGIALGVGLSFESLPQDDELVALLQLDVTEGDFAP